MLKAAIASSRDSLKDTGSQVKEPMLSAADAVFGSRPGLKRREPLEKRNPDLFADLAQRRADIARERRAAAELEDARQYELDLIEEEEDGLRDGVSRSYPWESIAPVKRGSDKRSEAIDDEGK